MKTSIINLEDQKKWNEIILRSDFYDFYHCNSYNNLERTGQNFLFVVEDDHGDFVALPLIKREIEGTDYFDCTSVYGYAGPISSKKYSKLPMELIEVFQKKLLSYLRDENFVSAFSRLHPIADQSKLLDGIGEILQLNKTVAIDLTISVDEQRRKYRKSNKSEINQLRNKGFIVKQANTEEELDSFISIYTETMHRVSASKNYFFDEEYFYKFFQAKDFSPLLLLAYKEDEIAAGAIFTTAKNVMQYHLAGTKEYFMKQTPMKLILDEARLLGNQLGQKYLHLGGGVGGKDEDPLYRFKSGFSDLNFVYKVWRLIVDENKYKELIRLKSANRELDSKFFPLYRG
jgi:hypothetical protein